MTGAPPITRILHTREDYYLPSMDVECGLYRSTRQGNAQATPCQYDHARHMSEQNPYNVTSSVRKVYIGKKFLIENVNAFIPRFARIRLWTSLTSNKLR